MADNFPRLDAPDLGRLHPGPRGVERTVGVDRPAGVVDDQGLEAGRARVERRKGDAIVGREPAAEDAPDAALAQERRKPGRRPAVRLDEGRVGIDVRRACPCAG